MRKHKRTISDLGRTARDDREKDIRIAFEEVSEDSIYLYLDEITSRQDVTTLPNFNKFLLRKVVVYDPDLQISPFDDEDVSTRQPIRGFGRTIRDWASLIAWNFNPREFYDILPGLQFFWDNRSYSLGIISQKDEEHTWTLNYSQHHRVSDLPRFDSRTLIVKFTGNERDFYKNLFQKIPGDT